MSAFPEVRLESLDTLWFQVAGTVCNLACTHCFISCSPDNHAHEMLSFAEVERYLREAERLGVREYYFTGGEPFMNRELFEMLEAALRLGPVSVLSNGILIKPAIAERLAALERASEHSLDLRISLDGFDAATNDAVRGDGTFERILEGLANLSAAGLNPVVTVTEVLEGVGTQAGRTRFLATLRGFGLDRPRLKVLPLLRIGAEARRERAYTSVESLRGRTLSSSDLEKLQCSSGRMVTSRGVYVCPILIDQPGTRMAGTLAESMRSFSLAHAACYTCHEEGLTCRT